MAYRFVGPGNADEVYLLPPDVRDWLPPRHLAWALLAETGRMDLSAFTGWYRADGQGRPAYHPAMMVALLGYCYCKGIRSSRAVEAATFDDLGARVICGNHHPDHATVARFLARHEAAVKGLLVASIAGCAREGLVSVDVVAGDGTKVRASAAAARNASTADLDAQIADLEKLLAGEVEAWVARHQAEDATDATDGGDGAGPPPRDRGRSRTAATLARRRQARTRLEAAEQERREQAAAGQAARIARLDARAARARQQARALAAAADAKMAAWQRRAAAKAAAGSGRARRPGPGLPDQLGHVRRARQAADRAGAKLAAARAASAAPEPGKINTTDPASKMMQAKNGGFGQQHNVQVLAGKHQVIYAIADWPSPVDTAALHPLLAKGRANLDAAGTTARLGAILFDAGYASDANFTARCEGDLHVAVTREARQTGRLNDGKHTPHGKQSWQQMAARLDTSEGKAFYKQRAGIIEPVFAQLFARLGTALNYRGDKVDLELHLWALTHNLLKAIRASHRRTASPAIQTQAA
jgi:transposase